LRGREGRGVEKLKREKGKIIDESMSEVSGEE
jgi:hypothetical protein